MLWDSSCSGNKEAAAQEFFNDTAWRMTEKPCFYYLTALPECTSYESSKTLSEFSRIKDWMRTPQCVSLGKEYSGWDFSEPLASCCGVCYIGAKNVDVYYWPEPGADKSCLSIVGDEVNHVTDDATTESRLTCWGCTAKYPTTSVLALDWLGSTYIWTSSMIVQSVIITAQMTNIDPITFKLSLHNP